MRIMIVGGGSVGGRLAEILVKEKNEVVVIEKEEKIAEALGERLDALVLYGDATDRKILKDGNIEKCDAFFALTADDKTNLMVCEVAKSFKVPVIVARVNDISNEPIFMELGITAAINTTTAAILAFKKVIDEPEKHLINYVAGGKAVVFERAVQKKSKIVDKKIGSLKNRFVISGVYRNGEYIKPEPETKIMEGDILIICTPLEEVKNIDSWF